MGIISLSDTIDVPFPQRLFVAMADFAEARGEDAVVWGGIKQRFFDGGSFLDVQELNEDELVTLRRTIACLIRYVEHHAEFAGFQTNGVLESLTRIDKFLNN
ncbi:MAG: hypothetical protein GC186_12910 [Rhodobacteraceae bacterium]|nr:hypothetical protein [Paracoccaceae bacterium]